MLAKALILGLARHITQEDIALKNSGPWQSTIGDDLHGRYLGLLGLGKTGSLVAKIGLAFGMEVIAWSQDLTQERVEEVGVKLAASKEELLSKSDFISIHLVLSDRTRGLLGMGELSLMKPTAYLINTSRAQIVDQEALITALESKWIAGAGLDVFDIEPLPNKHPFRLYQMSWLPHMVKNRHFIINSLKRFKFY